MSRHSALALAAGLLMTRPCAGAEIFSPAGMTTYFCEDVKKPFFVPSGTEDGAQMMVNARPQSLPASFTVPKPKGVRRAFVVGESAAALLKAGVSAPLSAVLEKLFPGEPVELINCGMGAYESRRISSVFEEVLAYGPDLIVVLSGNNENGQEFCPGLAAELVRRTRNIRAKLARLTMSAEDAAVKTSIALHEERLREMARLARAKGVPAVFCTLPANLRDHAPSGTPPFEQPNFVKGSDLLEKKEPAGALGFFRLNLKRRPREPFSLFYAGRALETLGRNEEAAAYYSNAVKYDPASDRCSAERNGMIRRVAAEEGGCLADLERAFSGVSKGGITGGEQLADGVHWFERYDEFVAGTIGGAVRNCPAFAGRAAGKPVPETPAPGSRGASDEDFRTVLSYAAAYISTGSFCDAPPNERAVIMLERLSGMDRAGLERVLMSPEELKNKLKKNDWSDSAKELPAWRPALLYHAAELFRRKGENAAAGRWLDEALELKADCPAFHLLRWRAGRGSGGARADEADLAQAAAGPRTRGLLASLDAALGFGIVPAPGSAAADELAGKGTLREGGPSKKMSDEAVELIKKGDPAGAKALLAEAVKSDGDNFEARMSLCYLAAKTGDVPLGEEHCSEAVFLAVEPPKHSIVLKDRLPSAFYARGLFYLGAGNTAEACLDLRKALEEAPSGWPPAAEARERAEKACAPGR